MAYGLETLDAEETGMEVSDTLLRQRRDADTQQRANSGTKATALAVGAVLLISATFLVAEQRNAPEITALSMSSEEKCAINDKVKIYKYTIASSKAEEDGEWAEANFGCALRDVTDTHGCASLGKTSCLGNSLAYNLHFVTNSITEAGDKDIAFWDGVMQDMHGDMTKFDPFMDYRLVFYTQDLSEMTKNLVENDEAVMLRSSESAGETWYSLIMQSPSGKIFEVVSTKLDLEKLEAHEKGSRFLAKRFKSWASEEESCAHTQAPSLGLKYTAAELDEWAEAFGAQGGNLLPIRNQIAVPSLEKTKSFWNRHFPVLEFSHEDENTDKCMSASVSIESYTQKGFYMETRFVENKEIQKHMENKGVESLNTLHKENKSKDRSTQRYSIPEFVSYIESVHEENTSPNHGWDVFYDRHLGLMFERCSLDEYMDNFFKNDVSFNPHGRPDAGTTDNSNSMKEHVWTEGTQGYGIEMQGFYDWSFRDCYTVFNWCVESTDGAQVCNPEVEQ